MPNKTDQTTETPVKVSSTALRALSIKAREWSGWKDAHLIFGPTDESISPWAVTDFEKRTITANIDRLLLNPHRVINTVTPFRLRQEAVLTGTLLHEAGHARHSHWMPRTAEQALANPLVHSDGSTPTTETVNFARIMEEPRIEGLMARDADKVGADTLDWTMRAAAAHLLPMTALHMDPAQQIMDLLKSWALRAGRQTSLAAHTGFVPRSWVGDFTSLVHQALVAYFESTQESPPSAQYKAFNVMDLIRAMVTADETYDTGSRMVDDARDVLALLFPETEHPPVPDTGCGSAGSPTPGEDSDDASDDESEGGEGGSACDAGDESDEQGSKGEEGQSEGDEAESGDSETSSGIDAEVAANALADLQAELEDIEQTSDREAQQQASEDGDQQVIRLGGASDATSIGGGWRNPSASERDVANNAARFMRDLIDPSESSRTHLTETPSASVDGAALAAWKASGEVRDPMFFRRTRRETLPTPPVKIAILVDISASMDSLQKPSALLSWALASAAVDLANFAGRGTQVESTLIHWGDVAKVIQSNGSLLPGIREVPCNHGTTAMAEAFAAVEEQIPGFFDITDHSANRLLVQFTDWELHPSHKDEVVPWMQKAFEAGVNMLTIQPGSSSYWSALSYITSKCPIQRGVHRIMDYNPLFPEAVWDEAKAVLNR